MFVAPSNRACVAHRRLRVRIRRSRGGVTLVSAVVRVNGKRIAARNRTNLTRAVKLRKLPKGRVKLRIRAVTSDGRAVTGTRSYRNC